MWRELSWHNWCNLIAYSVNCGVTYTSLTGIFGETNGDLSQKYQTLVTPAGFAFSIWGPIFVGEGVFTVAQLLPRVRTSEVVQAVTPWWVAACLFQVLWTICFAQEVIPLSLACMLAILLSLLGLAWSTDGLPMTCAEYAYLRAPFSLHLGWIIAATAVNANVQADAAMASPEALGGLAVTSLGVVCVLAAIVTVAARTPDPIVCLVAAWAFNGIRAELADPVNLDDPGRHNPYMWDRVTLGMLESAARMLSTLAFAGSAVALLLRTLPPACRNASTSEADGPDDARGSPNFLPVVVSGN